MQSSIFGDKVIQEEAHLKPPPVSNARVLFKNLPTQLKAQKLLLATNQSRPKFQSLKHPGYRNPLPHSVARSKRKTNLLQQNHLRLFSLSQNTRYFTQGPLTPRAIVALEKETEYHLMSLTSLSIIICNLDNRTLCL